MKAELKFNLDHTPLRPKSHRGDKRNHGHDENKGFNIEI